MPLRIHAICLVLNEEPFITELLNSLYSFCSGISIITQYDRDYYGNRVVPDDTIGLALNHPDPEGKVHVSVRRFKHEAAARNHEMLSIMSNPIKAKLTPQSGISMESVVKFYEKPDYFLIVDGDEIYDIETFPRIVEYLEARRPNAMRVTGYQYKYTWNQRVPLSVIHHNQFGFLKAGLLLQSNRVITWNESRLRKLFGILRLPDMSKRLFGYIDCPIEIGVFHHGAYLGGRNRLLEKFKKHSHQDIVTRTGYLDEIDKLPYDYIPSDQLPSNIRSGRWPAEFLGED